MTLNKRHHEDSVSSEDCGKRSKTSNDLKIISWNVNSWNAACKKGALDYIAKEDADIICIQETKTNTDPANAKELISQYPYQYWNHGKRKGYAGTAVLSKRKPLSTSFGFKLLSNNEPDNKNSSIEDDEGRVIVLEFEQFHLVATYVPNAGMKLERLEFKCNKWNKEMNKLLQFIRETSGKHIVWTGDLNVAVHEIDLARPKENKNKTPGFTDAERKSFEDTLSSQSLVDAWRLLHPDKQEFTYYSYRFNARQKRLGWRLDYFAISKECMDNVLECEIRDDEYGPSDHVPLVIKLGIK